MHFRVTVAFVALILVTMLGVATIVADGRVTQSAISDPVTTWRIATLTFPLLNSRSAVVQVAYLHASGTVDHVSEITISGADYDPFLGALSTSAGAAEGDCATRDETGNVVSVDRACVLNLRLSSWLVTKGKIEGVTAEPLTATTGS